MNYDEEFLNTFNEYYPFERYIVKTPKPINYLFDDALLIEIFVPDTEIKPIIDENKNYICSTSINDEDIYVKIQGSAGEMRFAYYDFNDHIREEIRDIVRQDFGLCEWQDLYVENEDYSDLQEVLLTQMNLITNKYGECNIKTNFKITDTINLLK